MPNLSKQVNIVRSINATAAGTSAINGTHVDMEGWDSVVFICLMGTLTATQVTSLKAQNGSQSNDSDQADITGAVTPNAADADSNKALVLEVYRPQKRYVRPVVNRGTANAVIDGVVAIQYQGDKLPPAALDTTISQLFTALGQ